MQLLSPDRLSGRTRLTLAIVLQLHFDVVAVAMVCCHDGTCQTIDVNFHLIGRLGAANHQRGLNEHIIIVDLTAKWYNRQATFV